jgi:hypothetical protein
VVRDEYLLAGYQAENALKDLTHLAGYTVTRTLSRKNSGAKSAPFGQTSV